MPARPIKPDQFAELAWRVLFLKGAPKHNRFSSTVADREVWVYEDEMLFISDFKGKDNLTIRYSKFDMTDHPILLSKRRGDWECFYPDERAVAHLEGVLVLDTLANL